MIKQLLFFVIVFLLSIILILQKEEKFNEIINLDGDFYIPSKDNILDFRQKSINGHKICIYDDRDPNKTDLECINAEQLLATLKLPFQRKEEVCVDSICLNKNDLEVLNGRRSFKLQSKDKTDNRYFNKCLYEGNSRSHICGQGTGVNISTLKPSNCNSLYPINFVLVNGINREGQIPKKIKKKSIREIEKSHHKPN